MPTIGEVYNPLIEAAKRDDPNGHKLLREVGEMIANMNPERRLTVEEGIEAARSNLDYYCQYFSADDARKVKEFYGLGPGFRDLMGNKWGEGRG